MENRAALAFLVLLATSVTAQAYEFTDANLILSVNAIHQKDHLDKGDIALYRKLFKAKCAKSEDLDCALEEKEVRPDGRADHTLLFRGEHSAEYPYPGSSTTLRDNLTETGLCVSPCTYAKLSDSITARLKELAPYYFAVETSTSCVTDRLRLYDVRDGIWKSKVVGDCQKYKLGVGSFVRISQLAEPPPPRASNYHLLDYITESHVDTPLIQYLDRQGQPQSLDALVSFSYDPKSASEFAGPGGRLIVISVPKEKLLKTACPDRFLQSDELIDLDNCKKGHEEFSGEAEVDAGLFTPPQYIFDSILTPRDN